MAKMITLQKSVDDKVKTPQVKVVLETLESLAGVGTPIEYSKLVEAVDKNEKFVSRQGAAKVIRFYEKAMVQDGLVVVEGTDKPESVGKPPKSLVKAEGGEKAEKPERKASKRTKGEHDDKHEHAAAAE